MAWVYLVGLALVLWGACGGVVAIGRKVWSIDTTLRVHLIAAAIVAFLVAAAHRALARTSILSYGPLRSQPLSYSSTRWWSRRSLSEAMRCSEA
jgi:hypothetical protein